MTSKQIIRSIRIVASFGLLGAVIAGIVTGWTDQTAIDYRSVGAFIGVAVASIAKVAHII